MRPRLKQFPILSTAILIALIARLLMSGLSWVGVTALVISVVWTGFEFVKWLQPHPEKVPVRRKKAKSARSEDDEPEEDLVSLVYFLSEAREADETAIRRCVAGALDIAFDTSNPDSEYFVMQFSPPESPNSGDDRILHFMIRIPQGLFAVLVSDKPYIDKPEDFAKHSIRDKRLRQAVESHQAWLSVDLMDEALNPTDREEAYAVIGNVLSYLAGPDCLAVYCPELQRCNEFDLTLIETLASNSPLDLFDEPTFEPIIEISDNNPEMASAVAEAKRRWPEFVRAFNNRALDESDRYIVKAEFREDTNCEYMWVQVEEIGKDKIEGILMNDPHELLDIHRGARVTLSMNRLNDWIFPTSNGSHVGGFTLDVLAEGDD
ncbi:MAG: DUF2314 domain-containing protein [Verrucomicrobiales bacterium]|nr:DUF2314 domain-containing protein [Verrucomicrobiales bacterium]